jgi:membrane fusion protein, multidrug efflux system
LIAPGTPVYTLVDNARLELECLVPSNELAGIRQGQKATFTTPTWGERVFEGTVSALNPMVEADNRSIRVILKIANHGGELRSGMYARGEIRVGMEKNAVVIPRSAFLVEQEQASSGSVFVVAGGKVQRRPVQLGGSRNNLLWIVKGLAPEDQVVIDIGPSLRDGQAVRVRERRAAEER